MDAIKEQINEQRDKQSDERLAQALGLTIEELYQLDYDSTPITSGNIVTAYEYSFSKDSPQEILEKIKSLSAENTIQLGIYDLETPSQNEE